MSRKSLTSIVDEIAAQRAAIMERAKADVEAEWREREARHANDTAERDAIVATHRERESRLIGLRAARAAATAEASDASIEGADMASNSPTTTDTTPATKKTSTRQRIQREMAEATKRGKPAAKASATGKPKNGKPVASKPVSASKNGAVHVRKMKSGRFILIKDPKVYGTKSNWAVSDSFATEQGAIDHAKKHGLKVAAA